MFTSMHHQYTDYTNQELYWLPMDTESRYNENLKTNYTLLQNNDWIDTTFTYKFNNYGFRADEFSHNSSVVFLGCSQTCGIGLPLENTWAHIVSQELKLKNFNLGIGGGSNDTAFRMAHHWLPQLTPKLVVFLPVDRSRLEIHTLNSLPENLLNDRPASITGNFWKTWITNNINSDMNYLKNTLAIKQICYQLNIKLIFAEQPSSYIDLARDLTHSGINTNKIIADQVLAQI